MCSIAVYLHDLTWLPRVMWAFRTYRWGQAEGAASTVEMELMNATSRSMATSFIMLVSHRCSERKTLQRKY